MPLVEKSQLVHEIVNNIDLVFKRKEGLDPIHSIDAIYLESGFNSRATFYRAFKKSYDCSPIEYMEQIKNKTP